MAASEVIIELRKRLKVSRRVLALKLGFKGQAIIWFYEKRLRYPSHDTWMRIKEVAEEVGMDFTMDMMKEEKVLPAHDATRNKE